MKTNLFIVEGSHDVALLGRVLKTYFGFNKLDKESQLSKFAKSTLPKEFPFHEDGDRLEIFNVVPTFFGNDKNEICCMVANGQDNLLRTLNDVLIESDGKNLKDISIVIFADADNVNKANKLLYLKSNMPKDLKYINETSFDDEGLHIDDKKITINIPIYVFPNNKDCGSIEDTILENLELENNANKELLKRYTDLVDSAKTWSSQNSKREKAIIGGLGNIYASGYSNSVIIESQKFKWFNKDNAVGGIEELKEFLKCFLGE